jgi:tetratricopeptide (TPR) repeat protein
MGSVGSEDDPVGLVEEGVRLSRAGEYVAAERVLARAEGALAGATDPASRRLLVTARWRRSTVLHAAGRAADALPVGRAGLEVGRALLAEAGLTASEPTAETAPAGATGVTASALTAEVATAAVDLAEAAFAADREDEAFGLLEEALAWTGRFPDEDRDVRRVHGTALHNRAVGLARGLTGLRRGDPEEALRAVQEAVRVRTGLRSDDDLLSLWELADTRLLQVRAALLADRPRAAVTALSAATPLLVPLGPGGADLRTQARRLAAHLESVAPAEVHRRPPGLPWPR